MERMNILILITVALLSCKHDKDSAEEVIARNILTTKTIEIDQQIDGQMVSRSVIVQAPSVFDAATKYPLVFAFHGGGGNNNHWVNTLKQFTDSGAFIGIYPQGHLNFWNLGPEPSTADDVAFVNIIVETLLTYTNVDSEKIFAIGASNGAGMVNTLAAKTQHFKAIAPVATQLIRSIDISQQTKPVSIFQINGAQDNVIPIEGGERLGHSFFSAYESARKWAVQFGCDLSPVETIIAGNTSYVFSDCSDQAVVQYLRIENAGHRIPYDYPQLWQHIWTFFSLL
jgi:polyhydroxybutyrate depolymerase|tara:strand:+ start:163 stop:1014 length:852 start_codon:yes stop_codon:yes gene_type:complete